MNIDIDGRAIFLERLSQETDVQLLRRKHFIIRGILSIDHSHTDDMIQERIKLSKYFHNAVYRGVTYPKSIQDSLNR